LRAKQCAPPVAPISQDAADQREQHDRQLLQEGIKAQEKGRPGQRQHHPVLRRELHPGANTRGTGAKPLDAEVTVGERREHPSERSRFQKQGDGFGRRRRLNGYGLGH
jgi:hypothetical protein